MLKLKSVKILDLTIFVPKNCIFAMWVNGSGSMNYRDFGCIPLEKIEGTVWIRIFPFNKFGKI